MMMRRQREMQENGGSLGCLGLEVSSNITQPKRCPVLSRRGTHSYTNHWSSLGLHALLKSSTEWWCSFDTALFFMQWKTTVATTCLRVTARRKKRKLQRRKKRRNPQRRNLLSRWEPEKPLETKKRTNKRDWFKVLYKLLVCPLQVNIKSLIFVHLLSLSSVKTCTWCIWYSSWRTTPGSPALRRLWRTWRRRRRK